MISVMVRFVRDTTHDFEKMDERLKAALRAASLKIAHRVVADAKRLAPVDTGRLKTALMAAGPFMRGDTAYSIVGVGSGVKYAPYVEFGTGRRGAQAAQALGQRYGWDVAALDYSFTWPGMVPAGGPRSIASETQVAIKRGQRAGQMRTVRTFVRTRGVPYFSEGLYLHREEPQREASAALRRVYGGG